MYGLLAIGGTMMFQRKYNHHTIQAMLEAGYTYDDIARKLGASRSVIATTISTSPIINVTRKRMVIMLPEQVYSILEDESKKRTRSVNALANGILVRVAHDDLFNAVLET